MLVLGRFLVISAFVVLLVISSRPTEQQHPPAEQQHTAVIETENAPPPSVIILESDYEGTVLLVRVTNSASYSRYVSHGDFRLLDANNTAHGVDLVATYWHGQGLPSLTEIYPSEAVEGWLVFDTADSTQPFTLMFKTQQVTNV